MGDRNWIDITYVYHALFYVRELFANASHIFICWVGCYCVVVLMINDDLISQAEDLVRDLRSAQNRSYTVTFLSETLRVPYRLAKPLVNAKILYLCSGCPHWHIQPNKLPDGMTKSGLFALFKLVERQVH